MTASDSSVRLFSDPLRHPLVMVAAVVDLTQPVLRERYKNGSQILTVLAVLEQYAIFKLNSRKFYQDLVS